MAIPDSYAEGFVFSNLTISQLTAVFASAGYDTDIGSWALRVKAPLCVKFGYVGNLTPNEPFEIEIDGHGVPVDEAERCCSKIAELLRTNGIHFEFTHIDGVGEDIALYQNNNRSEQAVADQLPARGE